MKHSKVLTAIAIVSSAMVLVGCTGGGSGENPNSQSQIVLSTTDMPQTLNPAVTHVSTTVYLAQLAFDGLTRPDSSFQATPSLAESWEISDDGLEYTFFLRKGVTFHDGSPFTSADVKYTWETILHPDNATAATLKPLFASIEGAKEFRDGTADEVSGITLPDDHTVHVKLASPYAPFLNLSAFQSILSKKAYSAVPPAELGTNPETSRSAVGTGPFKVEKWSGNEYIEYVANADYWGGAPAVDRLILKDVADKATIASQLRTGELDLTGLFNTIPLEEYEAFNSDENFTVVPLTGEWNRLLQPNVDDPILSDVNVRRALFHAVDREEILESLYLGLGEIVPGGAIHSNSWAHYEPKMQYNYDPELAKKMLDEAGWTMGPDGVRVKDGTKMSFKLITQNNFANDFPVLVQQYWKAIGVEAKLDIHDFTTLQPLLANHEFQMNANWYPMGIYMDPDYGMTRFTCEGTRSYCSPDIDGLIKEAASMLDQDERKAVYAEIIEKFAESASQYWVVQAQDIWVMRSGVELSPNADTVILQFVNAREWKAS